MANDLQGSSHRLKAVGGAYDKRKDLFMKSYLSEFRIEKLFLDAAHDAYPVYDY